MSTNSVFSASTSNGGGNETEPPDGGAGSTNATSIKPKASFKDMVMGKKEQSPMRTKVNLLKENLAKIVYEDDNPLKPMVHIEESVLEGLYATWQDAHVVKLLGKKLGYTTMKDRLIRQWKLIA